MNFKSFSHPSVIVAIISVIGTLILAILQSGLAKQDTVQTIVSQLNDKVIPGLQQTIDSQEKIIFELRSDLSFVQGRCCKETQPVLLRDSGPPIKLVPTQPVQVKRERIHKIDLELD